jgi:hypothetical protein
MRKRAKSATDSAEAAALVVIRGHVILSSWKAPNAPVAVYNS